MDIDTILTNLSKMVEERKPIPAHIWLESAQRMTILLGNESENLYKLQQQVSQAKLDALKVANSVAEAKIIVESTDLYRIMRTQEAKIKRVEEMARIAKKQATLSDSEMRLQ